MAIAAITLFVLTLTHDLRFEVPIKEVTAPAGATSGTRPPVQQAEIAATSAIDGADVGVDRL